MRVIASAAKHCCAVLIGAVLLFSFPTAWGQTPASLLDKGTPRPLNLVVLGDSISWGQGLKDEHKAWYLVKTWLQKTSGREVQALVEAHSGAVIGSPGDAKANPVPRLDGELSRGMPSVNDQLDDAVRSYGDPRRVDLVIVDGCINDLDSRRLLNAANTADSIRKAAEAKCGEPMEALLARITASFPRAYVVVTGYYPIISEKTANDFFMRALAKRFYAPDTVTAPMNDKQLRERLIQISSEWYRASNQVLSEAARKVDARLAADGLSQKVRFAQIAFLPEHSFAASQSRLWGFNASILRKFLVLVTLGRVTLKTNDERRSQRGAACEDAFKRIPGEKPDEKRVREDRLMRCRLAAIGHPNRKGAIMYADAISNQLTPLVGQTGWLKDGGQTTGTVTGGNPR